MPFYLIFYSEKEAAVMKANSWLYQFYSLHSKMHYGLAYEPHSTRLPTYYPAGPSTVLSHSYHPNATATAGCGPESATVPLHSVPYPHIHPAVAPINGTPGPHAHPAPVLQYSPQPGSLPYPTLIQATSAAAVTESESNRHSQQSSSHSQQPLKRPLSPRSNNSSHPQSQEHPEESESPEPNKRPNTGNHHLPPPPPSAYHHPRATTFGYPTSMFGPGGFSSMSSVTELGSVVPVSGYYSGHQMLASVPYHPGSIGHHFRGQKSLSLLDHDAESDLEQSLTPTNTEDVSNMISMTSSSSPTYFKYPPTAMHIPHQYYHSFQSGQGYDKELDKYVSRSPQSATSDYGSGTSSPTSAFERLRKDPNLASLEPSELSLGSLAAAAASNSSQAFQTLRNWNNHPVYADLSASKPSRIPSSFYQLKSRDLDPFEPNQKYGQSPSLITPIPSLPQNASHDMSTSIYHQGEFHNGNLSENRFIIGPLKGGQPPPNLVSHQISRGENGRNDASSPPRTSQSVPSGSSSSGIPVSRASRSPPSPSRREELNLGCSVGRASSYSSDAVRTDPKAKESGPVNGLNSQ